MNLSDDVLNSLTTHIAVLDSRGVIIGVNEAWRRFARDNDGGDTGFFVGENYLDVLVKAVRQGGDETVNAALQGITAMLGGERDEFSLEYPCNSPDEERWFILRVSRCRHGGLIVAHENITGRRQAENAARDAEKTLRLVLETLPVGVWIMDQAGRIVHGNRAGQQIWAGARYVGPDQFGEYRGWWLDNGEPIAAEEWAAARAIRKGETSIDEEIRIECFDGIGKIILNSAIPLRDSEHRITGAIIVNQDITERKAAEWELLSAKMAVETANNELQQALSREQWMARTDDLTGIYNRRHFMDLAKREFAFSERYGHPLSVIMFDIDRFKQINDTLGHLVGDEFVRHVAATAGEHLREVDVFARYGGDEFIILLPESDASQAAAVAERIRDEVGVHAFESTKRYSGVTISAGIAEVVPGRDTLDALIQRADQALYAAKVAGRNQVKIFSPAVIRND